jgi:DNA-binding CsgD family transcriptional regulator
MFSSAAPLAVSADQKRELELLLRNGNSPQRVALRCKVLLLAHEGIANTSIADQLKISRPTVLALRAAFAKDGISAITGIRRRKRSAKVLTSDLEQRILDTTLKTRPGDGSTHWSVRTLAAHLRVSRTIVHRVWQRHDVQPHRVERFKLSNDPQFEAKVRDVVGLYLDPPDRALVLCVDEKSQIQALDRTAPILPLRPGLPERQTHDYNRHGTTTLFAAFNILNGKVIGACHDRHRSREFIRFLNHLERQLPAEQESSPDHGQLLHAQEHGGPALVEAEKTEPLPFSFHPDQQFMAKSGRAVLRADYRSDDPPRHFPQCCRTRAGDLQMACTVERFSEAVRLESLGGCHS